VTQELKGQVRWQGEKRGKNGKKERLPFQTGEKNRNQKTKREIREKEAMGITGGVPDVRWVGGSGQPVGEGETEGGVLYPLQLVLVNENWVWSTTLNLTKWRQPRQVEDSMDV